MQCVWSALGYISLTVSLGFHEDTHPTTFCSIDQATLKKSMRHSLELSAAHLFCISLPPDTGGQLGHRGQWEFQQVPPTVDGRAERARCEGETGEWQPEHLDQRRQQSHQFCMAGFSMLKWRFYQNPFLLPANPHSISPCVPQLLPHPRWSNISPLLPVKLCLS